MDKVDVCGAGAVSSNKQKKICEYVMWCEPEHRIQPHHISHTAAHKAQNYK